MDGRTITVPLVWYPKLLEASEAQRNHWEICGGGYGIHWPDLDEDLSTEGLLRGAPAPRPTRKLSVPIFVFFRDVVFRHLVRADL